MQDKETLWFGSNLFEHKKKKTRLIDHKFKSIQ